MSMNAPITRIPPELLGEIFCRCTAFCADAPIILSAVCSTFRDVVRRTPPTWTRLRIKLRQQSEHRAKESQKAALWFAMAMDCPLSLHIELNGVQNELPAPLIGTRVIQPGGHERNVDYFARIPCVNVIQANIVRVKSLSIRTPLENTAHNFLHFVFSTSSYGSTLKRLTINVTSDIPLTSTVTPTAPNSPTIVPLPSLPSLRSLTLTNHSLPLPCSFANLQNFSFVRPLRAPPISLSDISHCLCANPTLVDVQIECRVIEEGNPSTLNDGHGDTTEIDNQPQLFTLPHLTHLSLRTNHLPSLLNALILPSITNLTIDDLDGKNPKHHLGVALRGLIVRSALATSDGSISITSLSLTSVCMFTHAITSWDGDEVPIWQWCFSRMSKLEDLTLANGDAAEHVGMLNLLSDVKSRVLSLEEDLQAEMELELDEGRGRGRRGGDGDVTRHLICPKLKMLKLSAPFVIDPFAVAKLKTTRPNLEIELHDIGLDGVNGVNPFWTPAPHMHSFQLNVSASHADSYPSITPSDRKEHQLEHLNHRRAGGFGFGSAFDRRRKLARSQSANARYSESLTKAEPVVMSLMPGDEYLW